jgi:hypothetical protein
MPNTLDQIIFATMLFVIAMTHQLAAYYAFRRLRDEVFIAQKTYIRIVWFLLLALTSVLIIFFADLLTLVFPLPTTCAKLH